MENRFIHVFAASTLLSIGTIVIASGARAEGGADRAAMVPEYQEQAREPSGRANTGNSQVQDQAVAHSVPPVPVPPRRPQDIATISPASGEELTAASEKNSPPVSAVAPIAASGQPVPGKPVTASAPAFHPHEKQVFAVSAQPLVSNPSPNPHQFETASPASKDGQPVSRPLASQTGPEPMATPSDNVLPVAPLPTERPKEMATKRAPQAEKLPAQQQVNVTVAPEESPAVAVFAPLPPQRPQLAALQEISTRDSAGTDARVQMASLGTRDEAPSPSRGEPNFLERLFSAPPSRVGEAVLDEPASRKPRVKSRLNHIIGDDPERATRLRDLISKHASANGIPFRFADAVVRIESRYNPRARNGPYVGLMQIHPATARSLGYSGDASGLLDPDTNLRYGVKYLAMAYRLAGGDTCGTVMRYQGGHRTVSMSSHARRYCEKVKMIFAENLH